MDIREKINLDKAGLEKYGAITIVAYGDSVTHGCVGPGEMDRESVYWNRLRLKLQEVRNYVPINVINAGIGGTSAESSLPRMDSQVLKYEPDLVIICFGLNDVNGPLENFLCALKATFQKCIDAGVPAIYMTPNMICTHVADDISDPELRDYAVIQADVQASGRMDTYMEKAIELAEEMGIPVCDCYGEWKALNKTRDITMLLANRINHPVREMHELFAQKLFDMIMCGGAVGEGSEESGMASRK